MPLKISGFLSFLFNLAIKLVMEPFLNYFIKQLTTVVINTEVTNELSLNALEVVFVVSNIIK